MEQQQPVHLEERWPNPEEQSRKTTPAYTCEHCPDKHVFHTAADLRKHALGQHQDRILVAIGEADIGSFLKTYEAAASTERSVQSTRGVICNAAWPPAGEEQGGTQIAASY